MSDPSMMKTAKRSMGALRLELPYAVWKAHEAAMRPLFKASIREHRLRQAVAELLDAEAYVPLDNAEDQYEANTRLTEARSRVRELIFDATYEAVASGV